jgi:IS66 Orf2 like protein
MAQRGWLMNHNKSTAMLTRMRCGGSGCALPAMIPIPSGVRVWLATGHTDMQRGFDGRPLLVQETLRRDPHSGHLLVFRGKRGSCVT